MSKHWLKQLKILAGIFLVALCQCITAQALETLSMVNAFLKSHVKLRLV